MEGTEKSIMSENIQLWTVDCTSIYLKTDYLHISESLNRFYREKIWIISLKLYVLRCKSDRIERGVVTVVCTYISRLMTRAVTCVVPMANLSFRSHSPQLFPFRSQDTLTNIFYYTPNARPSSQLNAAKTSVYTRYLKNVRIIYSISRPFSCLFQRRRRRYNTPHHHGSSRSQRAMKQQ